MMNDLAKLVLDGLLREAKKNALRVAPKTKLAEILALKSKVKVKELARIYEVKGYTKMAHDQLISVLTKEIQEEKGLAQALFFLEIEEWESWLRAVRVEKLPCDESICINLETLQSLGYGQTFLQEGQFYAVIPEEIRNLFKKMVKEGFQEIKEFSDLLHTHARAAVNLYGIIPQAEFVDIFNGYHSDTISVDEMVQILFPRVLMGSGYCFWKEYLISDAFEEDDFQGAAGLLSMIEGKPRYIPSKEAFVKYEDEGYYVENEYTQAMVDFFHNMLKDRERALLCAGEICFACGQEASMQDISDLIEDMGIMFQTEKQYIAFFDILVGVKNNMRLWANKGHTPEELCKKKPMGRVIPFPTGIRSEKIGRNEPCPCGSGKKYKHCCGR